MEGMKKKLVFCLCSLTLGLASHTAFSQDGDVPQDEPVPGDDAAATEPSALPEADPLPEVVPDSSQPVAPTTNTVSKPVPKGAEPVKGADAIDSGQELVNMDFPEQTEIKDIIKAVSLWTGKNVIIDPKINGKVQIISPKKVTKEEAYQAFLSALNVLGFTTVETGRIIKIMPVRTAVKGNLKTFMGSSWTPRTDELITQIIPLKYIDAKNLKLTLSRMVNPNSLIDYQPTNTLIVSDSGFNVRRILDVVELLDVQTQQPKVEFVPIRFADAKGIGEKVKEILRGAGARTGGGDTGGGYLSYKIMVDERTNSVIVFGPPRTIADIKNLIQKFDVRIEDPSRQASIHVRPLDYADAKKLATTLSSITASNSSSSRASGALRRPLTNRTQPGRPGEPLAASAADLSEGVKVTADESSNSLLITGSRSAYDALNAIIRKLDVRRSQVYVETDILDINMDDSFKFDTSMFRPMGGGTNKMITGWQAGPVKALSTAGIGAQNSSSTQRTNVQEIAGAFAEDLSIGILSDSEINIEGVGAMKTSTLIKLLKSDSTTRILSSPHILTADNEEATITVGEKIFFRSAEVNATTGTAFPKVEKEDVDMTLTLKPNVSHTGYVTMKVEVESSSIAGVSAEGIPRVNKRKSSQLVTVRNGQTVVISGLVRTQKLESYKKIPFLGDVPIIGWIFRNSIISNARNNLMIFFKPHIIYGPQDLAEIYKGKLKERDSFLRAMEGPGFKDSNFYALLPTELDGDYSPDALDEVEQKRLEELRNEVNRERGIGARVIPQEAAPAREGGE